MIDRCKARAFEFTSLSAQNISDTVAHEYDLIYNGRMATYATRDQLKRVVNGDPRYFFAQNSENDWLGKSGSFLLGSGKWFAHFVR